MLQVAVLLLPLPLIATALQPLITVPPSVNDTLPAGLTAAAVETMFGTMIRLIHGVRVAGVVAGD